MNVEIIVLTISNRCSIWVRIFLLFAIFHKMAIIVYEFGGKI
jgi:hypothetical protein